MTIVKAIEAVLAERNTPLSSIDIYETIVQKMLYSFKAINPEHVVRTQIRRHCDNLSFKTSSKNKLFHLESNGTYSLLKNKIESISKHPTDNIDALKKELLKVYSDYIREQKKALLKSLQTLDPIIFETFSKNLLLGYGFKNIKVTKAFKDGGIDGFGKLKVGIQHFNIAFQCKRWTKSNVPRKEIDSFRGQTQGKFEQGIFITTSKFTKEAQSVAFQAGAVPIILIDGPTIVEMMIDRELSIESEELKVYTNALDLMLS